MSFTPIAPEQATRTPPFAKPEAACCPVFDRTPWEGTTHVWTDRLFVRRELPQVLHMPVGVRRAIKAVDEAVTRADASPPPRDRLVLFSERSAWTGLIEWPVTRAVPGETTVRVSGTFFTKVFEGPYRDTPKWIRRMDALLTARGQHALGYRVHYAYCPKCAKLRGHNLAVVFAQLA